MSSQFTTTRSEQGIPEELLNRRLIWKAGNFGALAEICQLTGKSKTLVSMVLRGKRRNTEIEALLGRYGAPGFDKPEPEAAA